MSRGRILLRLKEHTAELHTLVERDFDLPRRLHDEASYADLLTSFYRIYRPLEERLDAFAGELAVVRWNLRRKSPKLHDDLQALGRNPAGIAAADDLPRIAEPADALGCLYVVEGATLGGKIIARAVTARLGLSADHGCAFFAGYGERGGEMWDEFQTALTKFADTARREEMILAAATATFETFRRHLAKDAPR